MLLVVVVSSSSRSGLNDCLTSLVISPKMSNSIKDLVACNPWLDRSLEI